MKKALKWLLSLTLCTALCLCLSTCAFQAEEPIPDYLPLMRSAAIHGDSESGHEAEYLRNRLIDEKKLDEPRLYYDELFLLSKFIQSQAGSIWLTDEFRLCVGEVAMNRVASPLFPDSLAGVIYQQGAFEGVLTEDFQCNLLPSPASVDAAMKLLLGERMMSPEVLYFSDEKQGEVYSLYSDARLGYTYFCLGPAGEDVALG